MGRKKVPDEKRQAIKQVNIALTRELERKLRAEVAEKASTMAQVVREILLRHYAKRAA